MKTLEAFHGDTKVKSKYVERVKAHQTADEIIQGIYWEEGKGCAVGCTIEGSDHNKYETELGIPKEVAYLEDVIFEELSNKDAKEFPLQFLEAVKVGSDLSKVVPQVVIWQFEDAKYGLKNIQEVIDEKEVYGFCEEVVALYKRVLVDEQVSEDEFYQLYLKIDARAGAWAWARARAGAWARAWAGAGAGAGAWAQAWAWARAWAGAEKNSRTLALRDEFLRLIKEAPMK